MTPAWLTRSLAEHPSYAGRVVRSFHYEEVAAPDGVAVTRLRFHLIFSDATKGEITLPIP